MEVIKGIYKITNPAGLFYIGQSINVHKRIASYRHCSKRTDQQRIINSIRKYGFENHSFELIISFPFDVQREVLDNHEVFIIAQYKEAGVELLNSAPGGLGGGAPKGGKQSKEHVEKRMKSKSWYKLPPETYKAIADKNKLNGVYKGFPKEIYSKESIEKGKETRAKTILANPHKHSDEVKQRIRESNIGKNGKIVLDLRNGIFYNSLREASKSSMYSYGALKMMLQGKNSNRSGFVYA